MQTQGAIRPKKPLQAQQSVTLPAL